PEITARRDSDLRQPACREAGFSQGASSAQAKPRKPKILGFAWFIWWDRESHPLLPPPPQADAQIPRLRPAAHSSGQDQWIDPRARAVRPPSMAFLSPRAFRSLAIRRWLQRRLSRRRL